jgi:4-methylaminobutanoate oxidase (formaldehyde-forming)
VTKSTNLRGPAGDERLLDDELSGAGIAITSSEAPERARAVVIGGGIIGVSLALHLARAGWTDTVLLERDRLSCGTTWHPAGLLASIRATHALTEIATYSTEAYAVLQAQTGIANAFNRRGCLTLARTEERMTELRYAVDMGAHHDIEAHLVSPPEIAELNPLLDTDGLIGGVMMPDDGTINPGASTLALAKLASEAGVTIIEGAAVDAIEVRNGIVRSVGFGEGRIECETAAVCAGLWSWRMARSVGVAAAQHAAEHMWVMSEPVGEPVGDLPYVRDLDGHFYVRGYQDRLVVGAFEPDGKPRSPDSIPDDFSFAEFEPDREHFALPLGKARERVPELRRLGIERWLNGPEAFTPDANPLLGESAEVAGLFFATGLNSQGILLGPGVGRAVAQWMVDGEPAFDSAPFDVRRFSPQQATLPYLRERTRETLGRLYAMHWPFLQPETARGARRTPLHERTADAGACFGELCGWERPNWYADEGSDPVQQYSYGRQNWFERVGCEHRAAREAVAIFDLSSFGKTLVSGRGAQAALQTIFSTDVDTEIGRVHYTTMLNFKGGIEVDLTITRLARDSFMIVAPTVTQHAVLHWLRWHVGQADHATVVDATAGYATLAVMGPRSRELISRLTDSALDNDAFPYQSAAPITVGTSEALALRVSFVGELGWELYVPSDSAVRVFDDLRREGADLGLELAGYYALDGLRIEKGYPHWGADIGPSDTPAQAGIGFTVDWNKPYFIGRAALEQARGKTLTRRLVHLVLEDPEPLVYHGETILRDGEVVGRVTSGAYAHTLGASAMIGMLEHSEGVDKGFVDSGTFQVVITGKAYEARATLAPLYDPAGERLRA